MLVLVVVRMAVAARALETEAFDALTAARAEDRDELAEDFELAMTAA